MQKALQDGGYGAVPTLANVDPPAHTRVRALAAAAFTNRRVAGMEPVVRDLVARFLDERGDTGHADLVDALCWGLPAQVLFRILGLGDEHLETVKAGSWSRILFVYGRPDDDTQVDAAIGLAAFWRFVEGLIAERADATSGHRRRTAGSDPVDGEGRRAPSGGQRPGSGGVPSPKGVPPRASRP